MHEKRRNRWEKIRARSAFSSTSIYSPAWGNPYEGRVIERVYIASPSALGLLWPMGEGERERNMKREQLDLGVLGRWDWSIERSLKVPKGTSNASLSVSGKNCGRVLWGI